MTDCLFCDIATGTIPTEFVYEDEQIIVFPDIRPKADTHLLFVPRQHISSLIEIEEIHYPLVAHMIHALPRLAKEKKISGFRTIINTGRAGGQEIDHLHFHLLAGKQLPKF